MTLKKSWRELSFLAGLSLLLVYPAPQPARAELSPDVGLKVVAISTKKAIIAIPVEQQNIKKVQVKKNARQESKASSKTNLKSATKKAITIKRELASGRIVAATIVNRSTLQKNVSLARTNVPVGLTPTITAAALSTNRGKTASVTIKTLPGATCSIDVFVVTRTPVRAVGLEDKSANNQGVCSWQWTVRSSTPKGSWGVKISASQNGASDDIWTTLNVGAVH